MAHNVTQFTVHPSNLRMGLVIFHLLAEFRWEKAVIDEDGNWTLDTPLGPDGAPLDGLLNLEYKAAKLAQKLDLDPDYAPIDGVKNREGYYLYGEDGGFTEDHARILQHWMREDENAPRCVWIEGAHTCSKMRPGGFGGFSCFITRKEIEWESTERWLKKCISRLNKELNKENDND